eukprot:8392162-Lingulodinium_polyedra.AAC.1
MGVRIAVAAAAQATVMPPGSGSMHLAAASPGPSSRTCCERGVAAAPMPRAAVPARSSVAP